MKCPKCNSDMFTESDIDDSYKMSYCYQCSNLECQNEIQITEKEYYEN